MMALRPGFIRWLAVGCALLAAAGRAAGNEEERHLDRDTCYRGVAVLSSDIGEQLSVDEVVDFAKTCKLNLVIIDYAWITHHWPRTDQTHVRRLITQLQHEDVEVAAMYRPRAMNPSEADVHWAVTEDGKVPQHHNELCFAHDDSVQWGASWGRKILETQPGVNRIILYNLRSMCRCPECRGDRGRQHAAAFIDHCRRHWRQIRPNIEIGHVSIGTEYADNVDFLCPFLSVNRDNIGRVNIRQAVSRIVTAKSQREGQPVIPLVKICWASQTNNTTDDVVEAITCCTRAKIGFILWYYEWLLHSETDRYDRKPLVEALGGDFRVMQPHYARSNEPARRPALRNNPHAWIYFESKESRDGRAPLLLLKSGRDTRQIRVSADATLILYIPDRPFPAHPQLGIRLDDGNRTLLHFDVPRLRKGATLDRAELILDMKNGTQPVAAPFDLAVHAVTRTWDERTATWQNQPSFLDEPALALSVRPTNGILRLEVTGLVRAWMRGRLRNNGMLLKVASPLTTVPTTTEPTTNIDLQLDDIAIVAVKDFMRIENAAEALTNLEFHRYFPVIDDEQAALAHWITARTDDGEKVQIEIADVTVDPEGNLIHRYRIDEFPAATGVSVTVTSLLLRRERPAPEGEFPIPPRHAYPNAVQPFLRSTAMTVVDHPEIRAVADRLLDETHDAYEIAGEVAAIMRQGSYKQQSGADPSLPTSARVLKYGGSCCGSAVAAAAVLRACGVPTQITYCPAGYVHGIIRFYLNGYGWCRMDATNGVGKLPLVQKPQDRGLVRLFDMPIEMESIVYAYAWPYQHNTLHGPYVFLSDGRAISTVRFAARDEAEANKVGRVAGRVNDPFPHLEPGSWNTVLELKEWRMTDARWSGLVTASRDAVITMETGVLNAVVEALDNRLSKDHRTALIQRLEAYGTLPD